MKLELTIEVKGAALVETDHETGEELGPDRPNIGGLMRAAANSLEDGRDKGTLLDHNGNIVGSWTLG